MWADSTELWIRQEVVNKRRGLLLCDTYLWNLGVIVFISQLVLSINSMKPHSIKSFRIQQLTSILETSTSEQAVPYPMTMTECRPSTSGESDTATTALPIKPIVKGHIVIDSVRVSWLCVRGRWVFSYHHSKSATHCWNRLNHKGEIAFRLLEKLIKTDCIL